MKKTVFIKAIWLTFVSLAVILLTVNCQRPEDDIFAPVVKSVAVSNITENSATISGMIVFEGGSRIIEQGIYLDETRRIPISYVNGNSIFGITISDFLPNTSHTVRFYAINGVGIGFGASIEFTTLDSSSEPPDSTLLPPVLEIRKASEVKSSSAVLNGVIKQDYMPEGFIFSFEYGVDGNLSNSISISSYAIDSIDPASLLLSTPIENLQAGVNYTYRLKAEDSNYEVIYSQTTEFETTSLTLTFSILNTKMSQVETDEYGNVYVTGTTLDVPCDGVVAKFDSSGQLLWSTKISTENYDYPRGGLIIKDNVLYVHANRYDEYGIGAGKLYVDAYNGDSGSLLWSTLVSEGYGSDMALSEDGFIYSVAYIQITKLDLSGNIVSQFTAQGAYGFDVISIYDDNKLFVAGGNRVPIGLESMAWCFDKDLNLLWSNPGVHSQFMAGATSIVSFPEENLIFLGETQGNLVDDIPVTAYVVCYEVKENSLEFKWKKLFGGNCRHPRMMREQSNFYVYSSDYEGLYADDTDGPVLMDIDGNILWTASPKINGYMDTFGNKMYVANGSDKLTIISM